jgi:cytochrome c-type biogenesis protein CcmH
MARENPTNPDAWSFLGRARAQAGDSLGAAQALERAVALRPGSADDWTALGEMLTELNNGRPGDDAVSAFRKALAIDPRAPGPKYYLGRAELAAGRKDAGLKLWREASSALEADDPRRAALEGEIRAAETGGQAASPAARIAAADPAAQEQAIRGMVAGLAERLDAAPNDPQGWARLVRAYTVLGDTAARDRALGRARTLFRDRPAELQAIEQAAR